MVKPAARREAVVHLKEEYSVSKRRACGLMEIGRSTFYYEGQKRPEGDLREALKELALKRRRFGYRRLHVMLKREGWPDNHKRVYRIYREEGLQVRRRKRKRVAKWRGEKPAVPERMNERWSLDFVHDTLSDGRRLRVLVVVDDCTRECLDLVADTSLTGRRVARTLERLKDVRGLPDRIVTDNGPEFTSKALDAWAYVRGVKMEFIEPGKPIQNAYAESFIGKFRDECLNEHWFVGLEDARKRIEEWRVDYNRHRPHSSLGDRTPSEFARQMTAIRRTAQSEDSLRLEVVQ